MADRWTVVKIMMMTYAMIGSQNEYGMNEKVFEKKHTIKQQVTSGPGVKLGEAKGLVLSKIFRTWFHLSGQSTLFTVPSSSIFKFYLRISILPSEKINRDIYSTPMEVRRQISTTAEEVTRIQILFPYPSWLTSGRTFGHQNLVLISIFPEIDNCLKAKRWLSTLWFREAPIYTHYLPWMILEDFLEEHIYVIW